MAVLYGGPLQGDETLEGEHPNGLKNKDDLAPKQNRYK